MLKNFAASYVRFELIMTNCYCVCVLIGMFCIEITLEAYSLGEDGYRPANESKKAKVYRDALSQLLQLVESTVDKRCVSSAINSNNMLFISVAYLIRKC